MATLVEFKEKSILKSSDLNSNFSTLDNIANDLLKQYQDLTAKVTAKIDELDAKINELNAKIDVVESNKNNQTLLKVSKKYNMSINRKTLFL